jgi:hypothetical protein
LASFEVLFLVTFNCLDKYEKMPGEIFLSGLIALYVVNHLPDILSYVAQATQHTEPKKCKHKFLKSAAQNSILLTFVVSFLLLYEDNPF